MGVIRCFFELFPDSVSATYEEGLSLPHPLLRTQTKIHPRTLFMMSQLHPTLGRLLGGYYGRQQEREDDSAREILQNPQRLAAFHRQIWTERERETDKISQ